MKNFTSTLDHENKHETLIEEGFENALIVEVDEDYDGHWSTEVKKVISPSEVQKAYSAGKVTRDSYYWLVRRSNGSMYPFPLVFVSQQDRQKEADQYNNETWRKFYAGGLTSETLNRRLVDCPSEDEISELLTQVEELASQGEALWDDMDQRGGLVPRWAV